MGILDLFSKKKTKTNDFSEGIIIYSPCKGKIIPLEEVPDAAFAQRMIGEGLAIAPENQDFVTFHNISALANLTVYPTGHACTFEIGPLEVLIHVGIDTVKLKGEGFELFVNTEKQYPLETAIVKINKSLIESKKYSCITPIVITNQEITESIDILVDTGAAIEIGQPIMSITLKKSALS